MSGEEMGEGEGEGGGWARRHRCVVVCRGLVRAQPHRWVKGEGRDVVRWKKGMDGRQHDNDDEQHRRCVVVVVVLSRGASGGGRRMGEGTTMTTTLHQCQVVCVSVVVMVVAPSRVEGRWVRWVRSSSDGRAVHEYMAAHRHHRLRTAAHSCVGGVDG